MPKVFNQPLLRYGKNPINVASMVLIYKKGNPADFENYRPISLMSHICKLFIGTITIRFRHKLDLTNIESRQGFETNNHMFIIKQLIEKNNRIP